MLHKVISTLRIGNNTAAIIKGNLMTIRNGMTVTGTTGRTYKVISVGMAAGIDLNEVGKNTDLLIEGEFNEKDIIL